MQESEAHQMTPNQIEQMCDRICGMYPGEMVSTHRMFTAWKADEYLLGVHINHARSAMSKVERLGKIPTLYEYKSMVRSYENTEIIASEPCRECGGNGWDTGYKVTDSKMMEVDGLQAIYEVGKVITEPYRDSNGYTYVIPCKKCAA